MKKNTLPKVALLMCVSTYIHAECTNFRLQGSMVNQSFYALGQVPTPGVDVEVCDARPTFGKFKKLVVEAVNRKFSEGDTCLAQSLKEKDLQTFQYQHGAAFTQAELQAEVAAPGPMPGIVELTLTLRPGVTRITTGGMCSAGGPN
jgi:hypothetical protein